MTLRWPETRALVTGGEGFVGRHLVASLGQRGAAEILAPTRRECDFLDRAATRSLLAATRPDLLIHLAATCGGIGANRREPGRFFFENLMMGLHVIEEARLAGVKKLVVLGTVCAYPKFVPIPFREENLWDGFPEETNAPYAIAKKALLMQCQAYREQYGISAIYLLPANLYGPGDNFDLDKSHVIPALVRKMVEAGEANAPEVKAWGTGKASREFLYVEDCVEGILAAAERYDGGEPVNLGTGAEISIRDLASLIAVLADYDGRILWDADQPDGQPRRCLDTSRAKRYFGWQALTPLKEGLVKTISWYREERKKGPS